LDKAETSFANQLVRILLLGKEARVVMGMESKTAAKVPHNKVRSITFMPGERKSSFCSSLLFYFLVCPSLAPIVPLLVSISFLWPTGPEAIYY
jgi:hypothetical protein